jgi:hypothetical protein
MIIQNVASNDTLLSVFTRLAVELVVLLILIPVIYGRFTRKKENMFSFFLMGMVIFLICVLLKNVEIQFGIALGLFAIVSIIRFRSSNFSSKDMSYLFTVMGMSAINAMFDFPNPIRGTILFNSVLIITIVFLELFMKGDGDEEEVRKKKKLEKKSGKEKSRNQIELVYDKINLLSADKKEELLHDVSTRIGRKIVEIEIRKVDLIVGNAEIIAFCREKSEGDNNL